MNQAESRLDESRPAIAPRTAASWVLIEPGPDDGGLRRLRFDEFERFEVLVAGQLGLPQVVGVDVAEQQARPHFARVRG